MVDALEHDRRAAAGEVLARRLAPALPVSVVVDDQNTVGAGTREEVNELGPGDSYQSVSSRTSAIPLPRIGWQPLLDRADDVVSLRATTTAIPSLGCVPALGFIVRTRCALRRRRVSGSSPDELSCLD